MKGEKKSFVWHFKMSSGGSITFTHKHILILFLLSHNLCWTHYNHVIIAHSYSYCGTFLSFKCFMSLSLFSVWCRDKNINLIIYLL